MRAYVSSEMNIGVVGATGFIGKKICEHALEQGHKVVGFSRKSRSSEDGVEWRIFGESPDLTGIDILLNFAGETIAQRWTAQKKKEFYTSRIGVTETLVKAIQKIPSGERPRVLCNASAVGFYGDRGPEHLDEESSLGSGYLANLCRDWEAAASEAEALGVRVILGRVGIVLGAEGKAWKQMKLAFKLGGGGCLGNGRQWMPWIDVDDVAKGALYACQHEAIRGAVNLVSPDPRTNRDFTKTLGKHWCRPTILPAPKFLLRLIFGQFGVHLLDSYRVHPKVLINSDYAFVSYSLEDYLDSEWER